MDLECTRVIHDGPLMPIFSQPTTSQAVFPSSLKGHNTSFTGTSSSAFTQITSLPLHHHRLAAASLAVQFHPGLPEPAPTRMNSSDCPQTNLQVPLWMSSTRNMSLELSIIADCHGPTGLDCINASRSTSLNTKTL